MRHDVRLFPVFTAGPREFYERAVIDQRAPSLVEREPLPAARRPRNFVQCLPAFELRVLPVR